MELSMQETDTRFDEAIEAAARGESVVLTKHGRPVAKLVATQTVCGMDFEKAASIRRALGIDGIDIELPPDFDEPAFSRKVLGLEA